MNVEPEWMENVLRMDWPKVTESAICELCVPVSETMNRHDINTRVRMKQHIGQVALTQRANRALGGAV